MLLFIFCLLQSKRFAQAFTHSTEVATTFRCIVPETKRPLAVGVGMELDWACSF